MKRFILFIALALWSSQVMAFEVANLRGARSLDETNNTTETSNIENIETQLIDQLPDLPIEILTPEQEAYQHTHNEIPTPPEGFKQTKITNLKKDKHIMETYAYSIPSFLLKAIAAHHKLVKTTDAEERAHLAERGFLMPGPYLLDLKYIFKKKTEEGHIYIFGVVVNRCVERACTSRPYPCRNTAHFSTFVPNSQSTQKKAFLDWQVEMAPEGYMKCPVFNF